MLLTVVVARLPGLGHRLLALLAVERAARYDRIHDAPRAAVCHGAERDPLRAGITRTFPRQGWVMNSDGQSVVCVSLGGKTPDAFPTRAQEEWGYQQRAKDFAVSTVRSRR